MKIKVCGLSDVKSAAKISALPVDFCGMIFYEKSSRYVHPRSASAIAESFKPGTDIAGVFVNASTIEILEIVKPLGIRVIQLHGEESTKQCLELQAAGYRVIKVFKIQDSSSVEETEKYKGCCSLFLFDTATPGHGGSGRKFNWDYLDRYHGSTPFLLSGGIGPEDTAAIKKISHPYFYGIDINSRFETAPGIKDAELVKYFIDELKSK